MKQERLTLAGVLGGFVFAAGQTVLGAMIGGFLGGRVFSRGVGIDRLADALGGVMLGALVGIVAALIVVRRVRIRTRFLLGALGILGAVALVLFMKTLQPPSSVRPSGEPDRPATAFAFASSGPLHVGHQAPRAPPSARSAASA